MIDVVLDASAILARILHEPGGELVASTRLSARVSAVNLAEVASRLVDKGGTDDVIQALLDELPYRIEPFGSAEARKVGQMRRATRLAGLSLGDRACLELAARLAIPAYTADRIWAELDLGVEVVLIR
jgi:ribonuclease VapC